MKVTFSKSYTTESIEQKDLEQNKLLEQTKVNEKLFDQRFISRERMLTYKIKNKHINNINLLEPELNNFFKLNEVHLLFHPAGFATLLISLNLIKNYNGDDNLFIKFISNIWNPNLINDPYYENNLSNTELSSLHNIAIKDSVFQKMCDNFLFYIFPRIGHEYNHIDKTIFGVIITIEKEYYDIEQIKCEYENIAPSKNTNNSFILTQRNCAIISKSNEEITYLHFFGYMNLIRHFSNYFGNKASNILDLLKFNRLEFSMRGETKIKGQNLKNIYKGTKTIKRNFSYLYDELHNLSIWDSEYLIKLSKNIFESKSWALNNEINENNNKIQELLTITDELYKTGIVLTRKIVTTLLAIVGTLNLIQVVVSLIKEQIPVTGIVSLVIIIAILAFYISDSIENI